MPSIWIFVAFGLLVIVLTILIIMYKERFREFMSNAESDSGEDGNDGPGIAGSIYIPI